MSTGNMESRHIAVKAVRARLAAMPVNSPCAVQACKTLGYAERELERGAHREGLRMLRRAVHWLEGAEAVG